MKPVSQKAIGENENAADDRGRFVSVYFECSEIDGTNWQTFEKCACRGFKLKRRCVNLLTI
jgi:hypothetical protein